MSTYKVISNLENLLRLWEDYWFTAGFLMRMEARTGSLERSFDPEGPAKNSERYRGWLLGLHQSGNMSGIEQFIDRFASEELLEWRDFPRALAAWNLHSRRLYTLSPEVQAVLKATSLEGVTWSDVQLPFPSFMIALGQPYRDSDGTAYDAAMINEYDIEFGNTVKRIREIRLFVQHEKPYTPLDDKKKRTLNKLYTDGVEKRKHKCFSELIKKWEALYREVGSRFPGTVAFLDRDISATWEITKTAHRVPLLGAPDIMMANEGEPSASEFMLRIVAGLPLYLRALPSETPHVSDWQPTTQDPTPSASIVDGSLVCAVSSCYQLTADERVMLGIDGSDEDRKSRQLKWHLRAGHWRRPPGHGNDPNYPKTVHVRFTIVRGDRMPEAGLPEGRDSAI